MLNREGGRNPNLGFGMVPPKPATLERYIHASTQVLALMHGAEPNDETLMSISEVKGLCNRVLREDQADWIVVWLRLGLPNQRRLKWIAGDLPVLRQAVKADESELVWQISERLLQAGLGTALKFLIDGDEPPLDDGQGYLYLLSTRSDPTLIKIGQTKRQVLKRVEEINRATGVVDPFSPRRIWYVKDPERCERAVHELLKERRIRVDREFFRLEFSDASRQITSLLRREGWQERKSGVISTIFPEKRFGFIAADQENFFFHISELRNADISELNIGDEVKFDCLDTRLGRAAADIQKAI